MALGLSRAPAGGQMIRINLLPLKETERALGRRQQMSLVALGVATIALLIMVIPFLVQGRQLATLDARHRAAQQRDPGDATSRCARCASSIA